MLLLGSKKMSLLPSSGYFDFNLRNYRRLDASRLTWCGFKSSLILNFTLKLFEIPASVLFELKETIIK